MQLEAIVIPSGLDSVDMPKNHDSVNSFGKKFLGHVYQEINQKYVVFCLFVFKKVLLIRCILILDL